MRPINITFQHNEHIVLRVVQSRHPSEADQLKALASKVAEDIVLSLTITKDEVITVHFVISSDNIDTARLLIYGPNYAIESSDA